MRKRRKTSDDEQVQQGWLLTYADMITLVLTFFVMLYTMSTLDKIKFSQVIASLQGTLGIMDGGRTLDTLDETDYGDLNDEVWQMLKELEEEEYSMTLAAQKLEALLEAEQIQDHVYVIMDERGIIIRFLDHVLFDLGRADLKPDAKRLLDKIYNILAEFNNKIRVEGYTCDLPIRTAQFPSNWELSANRATNVIRYLEDKGLPGNLFSAVGYGEHQPLVPNTSEENRQQNRRVDLVILRGEYRLE